MAIARLARSGGSPSMSTPLVHFSLPGPEIHVRAPEAARIVIVDVMSDAFSGSPPLRLLLDEKDLICPPSWFRGEVALVRSSPQPPAGRRVLAA